MPTIPAETFTYDWQGFDWFILAATIIGLVMLVAGGIKGRRKVVGSGVVLILATFVMLTGVEAQSKKAVTAQYEAVTEQIENQYDVELDYDAICMLRREGSLSAPVGRSTTDLTDLVYGSYSDGNVLLMVARGKEFVSLDVRNPARGFDRKHGDRDGRDRIVFPGPGDRRYPTAGDDLDPDSDLHEFDAGH
ncbi:hypothetical protein [Aeromicrobium sp. 179-A 4D2 NHS]|uniref:hypothetical protein n=1 Tax=Aeromicrobium sp. 179-A 4D2 NHS TaxID=3142375 RepID=UPI0039A3DE70